MTFTGLSDSNINTPSYSRKKFLGLRWKLSREFRHHYPHQQQQPSSQQGGYTHEDLRTYQPTPDEPRFIPRQPHNPAVHPLLAKPEAREENFVLLPNRHTSVKRKRDPNSPVRTSIRPRPRDDSDSSEWTRYLQSYVGGRFNMSNPPEPPANRPAGHLKAPIPPNDRERLKELHKYHDVFRPNEPSENTSPTTRTQVDRFQRLVITARQIFETKIVLLSLVDEKRQFFKCEVGLGVKAETDRDISFCGHTILSNEPMVVLNAAKDWRLAENPLVKGWPHIRFYAGAPIITPAGCAIGTICVLDTEPRESFDVVHRRKLTEFARLAMDEIELAHKMRHAKDRKTKDSGAQTESSNQVLKELRGMAAISAEAGTINIPSAGKRIQQKTNPLDEYDVIESNVILAGKGGEAPVKFKYGRNSTSEIEVGARKVERASRKRGESRKTGKAVRVARSSHSRRNREKQSGKQPETSSDTPYYDYNTDKENRPEKPRGHSSSEKQHSSSEEQSKPTVHPKSALRTSYYGTQSPADKRASASLSDEVTNLAIPADEKQEEQRTPGKHPEAQSSSLESDPPETKPHSTSVFIPRTPAMPTYYDIQTRSNPELASQLIARALRVDFVYFMRLTPVSTRNPNTTGYPNAEVNLEMLGCYGLPFPTISFSPFTHLEALRSELGMIYYSSAGDDGTTTDDSVANARDHFKVGIVVPVWREYPRSSLTATAKARAQAARATYRRSTGSSTTAATSTTITTLRESCKKGVVVGVFSKRGDRRTFTRIEREYLKEWVSLRDHL